MKNVTIFMEIGRITVLNLYLLPPSNTCLHNNLSVPVGPSYIFLQKHPCKAPITESDVSRILSFSLYRLTCVDGIFAGHEGGARGRAKGGCVVAVEDHPVVGQCVDVGGGDLVRPVETDIVPSLQT